MIKTMKAILVSMICIVCIKKCLTQETTTTTIPSTSTLITTTVDPIKRLGDHNYTWQPQSTEQIVIKCEQGCKIVATIIECNINATAQEFATISSGKPNETLTFTSIVSNTPSYFFNYDIVYANFTGTNASILTVIFSRVDELLTTTTTEVPSSTIYLPTAGVNDSYELTVHVSGKDPYEYRNIDTLNSFKNMISQMAQEYCKMAGFSLIDSITADNVQIIEIIPCSPRWPECHPCGEVRFALPIHIEENTDFVFNGYQLNAQHLYLMWMRYSERFLTDGITVCEEEHIVNWVKWQIILVSVCTVVFFGLFLLLKAIVVKYAKNEARKRKRITDTTPIIFEDRTSQISLPPHSLQEIPALFENTYSTFNPGTGASTAVYENPVDNVEDDESIRSDNDIEESGA